MRQSISFAQGTAVAVGAAVLPLVAYGRRLYFALTEREGDLLITVLWWVDDYRAMVILGVVGAFMGAALSRLWNSASGRVWFSRLAGAVFATSLVIVFFETGLLDLPTSNFSNDQVHWGWFCLCLAQAPLLVLVGMVAGDFLDWFISRRPAAIVAAREPD